MGRGEIIYPYVGKLAKKPVCLHMHDGGASASASSVYKIWAGEAEGRIDVGRKERIYAVGRTERMSQLTRDLEVEKRMSWELGSGC